MPDRKESGEVAVLCYGDKKGSGKSMRFCYLSYATSMKDNPETKQCWGAQESYPVFQPHRLQYSRRSLHLASKANHLSTKLHHFLKQAKHTYSPPHHSPLSSVHTPPS